MNSVNLIGNLGNDPELRYTQSNKPVCSISLAVQGYNNKTIWVDIVAWNKQAETISKYFRKGSKIGISGRIEINEFTGREGNKRSKLEVVVNDFTFCERKQNGNDTPQSNYPSGGDFAELGDDDDELPFN